MCTHKKNNVHVPYEKQQHTKNNFIIFLRTHNSIPPSPTPASNTPTHPYTIICNICKGLLFRKKKEKKCLEVGSGDLKEPSEGFLKAKGRSFHVEGLKAEKMQEPTV